MESVEGVRVRYEHAGMQQIKHPGVGPSCSYCSNAVPAKIPTGSILCGEEGFSADAASDEDISEHHFMIRFGAVERSFGQMLGRKWEGLLGGHMCFR